MVELLEPPQPPPKRKVPNLILHCGATAVELDQVTSVKTPRATESWQPIPHAQLIQTVQRTLKATNLTIGTQAHSLTRDGQRYFGLFEVLSQQGSDDYCLVLGLRNSHDKTFPAGLVAGSSVFVCDNLSFSGEVQFARKHTRFINRDLPQLTERAIGQLMAKWHDQDKRISTYKRSELDDTVAHDLIIRSTDVSVISNRMIPAVLKEWREPRHEEFEARNAWVLFNSFTEALKDGSLAELPKRTQALHGLLDTHVGLSFGSN
jgi:hypothetical protein